MPLIRPAAHHAHIGTTAKTATDESHRASAVPLLPPTAARRVTIGPLADVPQRPGALRVTRLVPHDAANTQMPSPGADAIPMQSTPLHSPGPGMDNHAGLLPHPASSSHVALGPAVAGKTSRPARSPFKRHAQTIAGAGKKHRRPAWPGVMALDSEPEAAALIGQMFHPVNAARPAVQQWRDIVAALLKTGTAGAMRNENPILLAYGLSEAVGGDSVRAGAALAALQGQNPSPQAMRDAFTAARLLSRSGAGFEALEAFSAPVYRPADEVGQTVQREASRRALMTADYLAARWPTSARPPGTLNEMIQMANVSLPPNQQLQGRALVSPVAPEILAVFSREPLAARALICASMLAENPAAEPASHFRSAYFAARNGLMKEGKHTDLNRVQGRLAKLLTYIHRAANPGVLGKRAFLGRVFGGERQTPLSIIAAGLQGRPVDLHLPEFAPVATIGMVADHIVNQMMRNPSGRDPEALVRRRAVRVAALRHWARQVEHRVRRIESRLGTHARKTIAVDAATLASVPAVDIEKDVRYRQLDKLNPDILMVWATEEGVSPDTAPELLAAVTAMRSVREARRLHPLVVSPASIVGALHDLVRTIQPMSSIRFEDGGLYGPNTVIKETLRLPLIPHVPADISPSLNIAPDIRIARGRHAVVEISCPDEQSGALSVATTARSDKTLGGVVYLTFDQSFTTEYIAAEVASASASNHTRGVSIQARSDAAGDWQNKLAALMANLCGAHASQEAPALWDDLAYAFYKTPGISVNWIDDRQTKSGVLGRGMIALREDATFDNKLGPYGHVELHGGHSRSHHRETEAVASAHAIRAGGYRTATATGWIKGGVHPIDVDTGPVSEISFSSAVLGPQIQKSLSASSHSAGIRITMENGRVVPEKSYRDTEFTAIPAFIEDFRRRYPDIANTALWRDRLDQLAHGAHRAQGVCERLHMTNIASRRLDVYHAAVEVIEHQPGARTSGLQQLRHAISDLLEDPASWVHDAVLLKHETAPVRQVNGWSWLFRVQTQTQLTLSREHKVF